MKAALSLNAEGPEGLKFADVAAPIPGPDEIRVKVKATALNRADLMQTMGLYPAPPGVSADIPGLEYSGEVLSVGARVSRWKAGDRVMGLVAGGAWAEELVTHEREAIAIPHGLSFEQAAAIPEAFSTAFDALVLQAGMTVNSEVLLHAVASGVGTAALQLCTLFGAKAIGTGRNAAKLERASKLGLPHTVLAKEGKFAAHVKQLTGGRGADIALDLVGGDWFTETIDAMAPRGTVMIVGLVGGVTADLPLRSVLGKRLRILGTALRSRTIEEKIVVARAVEQRLCPAFVSGQLKPIIDATLPMMELKAALQRMAANDSFGKLVLTW